MKSVAIGRIDFDDPEVTPDAVWNWMVGTFNDVNGKNLVFSRNNIRFINTPTFQRGALLEYRGNLGGRYNGRLDEWNPKAYALALRTTGVGPVDDPMYELIRFQVNQYMGGHTFVTLRLEFVGRSIFGNFCRVVCPRGLVEFLSGIGGIAETFGQVVFNKPTDAHVLLNIYLKKLTYEWPFGGRITPPMKGSRDE